MKKNMNFSYKDSKNTVMIGSRLQEWYDSGRYRHM